jgi:Fe-S cluster assembly scaffold protein SufB
LLCLADKYGYGNWPDIKKALRREQRCRFEHIFISRSEEELKKRIIYLVQTLEKEQEEAEKKPEKTQNNSTSLQIPDNLNFLDA